MNLIWHYVRSIFDVLVYVFVFLLFVQCFQMCISFLCVLLIIKLCWGCITQGNAPAIIELDSLLVCMVYKYVFIKLCCCASVTFSSYCQQFKLVLSSFTLSVSLSLQQPPAMQPTYWKSQVYLTLTWSPTVHIPRHYFARAFMLSTAQDYSEEMQFQYTIMMRAAILPLCCGLAMWDYRHLNLQLLTKPMLFLTIGLTD